jgi:hypothetical protein
VPTSPRKPCSRSAAYRNTLPSDTTRHGDFHKTTRTYLPKRWFDANLPHTHVALDDALEQGAVFCNMYRENLAGGDGG